MQLLPLEIQLLTFSPYFQSALICSPCDSHSNNTFTQTHIFLGEPSLRLCAGPGRPLRPTWFISRSHFHHLDRDFPKGAFQKPHKEEDFPEEMRKHSWYRSRCSSCQRPQTQPQAAPIHRSLRYTCVCVCNQLYFNGIWIFLACYLGCAGSKINEDIKFSISSTSNTAVISLHYSHTSILHISEVWVMSVSQSVSEYLLKSSACLRKG